MPVLILFGENEFAFSVQKAINRASRSIIDLDLEVVKGASHLISTSKQEDTNRRVLEFIKLKHK